MPSLIVCTTRFCFPATTTSRLPPWSSPPASYTWHRPARVLCALLRATPHTHILREPDPVRSIPRSISLCETSDYVNSLATIPTSCAFVSISAHTYTSCRLTRQQFSLACMLPLWLSLHRSPRLSPSTVTHHSFCVRFRLCDAICAPPGDGLDERAE